VSSSIPTPPSPQAPGLLYASQFSVAMNLSEIALTLGQVRQLIDPTTGVPGTVPAIEWMATVVMTPQTAAILHVQLGRVLEAYAARFGVIPSDKNLQLIETGAQSNQQS
jgi:hypothetical protein